MLRSRMFLRHGASRLLAFNSLSKFSNLAQISSTPGEPCKLFYVFYVNSSLTTLAFVVFETLTFKAAARQNGVSRKFRSESDFNLFIAHHDVYHVNPSGRRTKMISTLEEALAAKATAGYLQFEGQALDAPGVPWAGAVTQLN